MKKIGLIALVCLLLITPQVKAQLGPPRHQYVFLLSHLERENDPKEALKQILTFFIEDTGPGDELDFYQGDSLQLNPITTIKIPEDDAYKNLKLKVRDFALQIKDLKDWLLVPGATKTCFRAPQLLRRLAEEPSGPPGALRIILIGSPLYDDPEEPDFSMLTKFPSDENLLVDDIASPFSAPKGNLDHAPVIWADLGTAHYVNDVHASRIERFWSLFVQRLGGHLAPLSPGFVDELKKINSDGLPDLSAYVLDEKDSLRMITPSFRTLPHWLVETAPVPLTQVVAAPTPTNTTSVPTPGVTVNVFPTPLPSSTPTPPLWTMLPASPGTNEDPEMDGTETQIGITWKRASEVDLDLYVAVKPGEEEVYYDKIDAPGIKFEKDFDKNPTALNGFELVTLLDNPDLHNAQVWVNIYEVKNPIAEPIEAEIRVHKEGKTYVRNFTLNPPDHAGNRGRDREQRDKSPYWIKLDLSQLP